MLEIFELFIKILPISLLCLKNGITVCQGGDSIPSTLNGLSSRNKFVYIFLIRVMEQYYIVLIIIRGGSSDDPIQKTP